MFLTIALPLAIGSEHAQRDETVRSTPYSGLSNPQTSAERMSALPGYLLAATLGVCAAIRLGQPSAAVATTGALTMSWLSAVVCAFY
jgi:hypothetical protein